MSGTAYGTVVLHVSLESAAGGPLAKVRTGDVIVLDVSGRRLDVDIPEDELEARELSSAAAAACAPGAGLGASVRRHGQAGRHGADLDFLVGSSGDGVSRESH
jgi:dihydroxyacid dehydratase/phosphogluconate dehydratase